MLHYLLNLTSAVFAILIALSAQNTQAQSLANNKSEKEMSFEVLKPTINKWIRGEKINSEFQGESYFRFQPYLIDVNGDGKKELVIRNNCSGVGNCQFWIFKRNGKSYQIILKSLSGAVQTFKFKTIKTNGYFDLETKDHNDAWSGEIEIYKFNGKKYEVSQCFTYNYSSLKDGKLYVLKKQQIIPIKCSK